MYGSLLIKIIISIFKIFKFSYRNLKRKIILMSYFFRNIKFFILYKQFLRLNFFLKIIKNNVCFGVKIFRLLLLSNKIKIYKVKINIIYFFI